MPPAVTATSLTAPTPVTLTPVRAYLRADQIPPPGVGAYGILALHGRPTAATNSRLTMACNAFLAYLPRQEDLPSSVPLTDQMLTIWPVDNPDAPEMKADKCDYMLGHYDLYAAQSAMQDAERQHGDFAGEGPFLIGWSPSDTRGRPDKLVLIVDMSSYDSQDRFDHALQFWKEKIVEEPDLWRSGWSLDQLRLAIRDFTDRYGSDIVHAVRLSH